MKCQSWVDPSRFNKKGLPTPRACIGTYLLDWDRFVAEVRGTLQAKRQEQRLRAIRCGGRLEFSMFADCGEEGSDGIEVEIRCSQCQDYVHAVGLNADVVERWIQERLDASE